jgi:hypothetical protein
MGKTRLKGDAVYCEVCRRVFSLDPKQQQYLLASRLKGMRFIVLKCALCRGGAGVDPQSPLSRGVNVEVAPARCPVERCAGYVSQLDGINGVGFAMWGCGSCGTTWKDDGELQAQIARIVSQYAHRRKAYVWNKSSWTGRVRELSGYEDDVAKEGLPKKAATKKPATKKPATKKPATKKPATKKPATKKAATKKAATKKAATKKAATKKPATKKPATKKPATKKARRG